MSASTGLVEVGQPAPDFTLKNQHGQDVTLSELRGRNVVVLFYPFAFSGICTGELCQLRDDFPSFEGVTVVGVSVDTPYSLKVWAERESFQFRLLSDFWPHGEVARSYGVFNDKAGMANRGTFLITQDGLIRFAELNQPGEPRDQQAWKKAIASL